jgi:hypothetical protein
LFWTEKRRRFSVEIAERAKLHENNMKKIICAVSFLVITLLFSGCGNFIHGKAIAEPQVDVFHSQLDDEKYSDIYTNATDEFCKAAPETKFTDLLSAVHRKLGKVVSTKTVTWRANTFNFKTQVALVQETKFEKGTATETFTFVVANDKATLAGYYINSTDMLIN